MPTLDDETPCASVATAAFSAAMSGQPTFRMRLLSLAEEHEILQAELKTLSEEIRFLHTRSSGRSSAFEEPHHDDFMEPVPCERQRQSVASRPSSRYVLESSQVVQVYGDTEIIRPSAEGRDAANTTASSQSVVRATTVSGSTRTKTTVHRNPHLLNDSLETETAGLGEAMLPGFVRSLSTGSQRVGTDQSLYLHTQTSIQDAYKYKADFGVLQPVSIKRITWDVVVFICLLFELWAWPFELVFCPSRLLPKRINTVSHVVTLILFVDIAVNFNTGYFRKGKTIMARREIVRNYLQFWFWIDLVSAVPWHWEVYGGRALRMVRFGKTMRNLQTLRFMRFLRLLTHMRRGSSCMTRASLTVNFPYEGGPIKALMFVIISSHIHGCLWAALHDDWVPATSFQTAFQCYCESFYWAYAATTAGLLKFPASESSHEHNKQTFGVWMLELVIQSQRVALLASMIVWCVCQAQIRFYDQNRLTKVKADALEYMKDHQVSFATQVQVLYILHETGSVRQRQRHFRDLMDNDLPVEVKRKICSELWLPHLRSFRLIDEVQKFDHHFLVELSLMVREEVFASKAIIFHTGDASIASYRVMDGIIRAAANHAHEVPDFTIGQWIGETALVNPLLRRRMTVMTAVITVLMAVPAEGFQELICRHHLQEHFQSICQEHLWKGLCGRCGALGEHNADECPEMENYSKTPTFAKRVSGRLLPTFSLQALSHRVSRNISLQQDNSTEKSTSPARSTFTSARSRSMSQMLHMNSAGSASFLSKAATGTLEKGVSRDLHQFLAVHDLGKLIPLMSEMGIHTLQNVRDMTLDELNDLILEGGENLSQTELAILSPTSIDNFRRRVAQTVQRHVFGTRSHHYIFLSHFKLEAGTEAALMQKELEHLIAAVGIPNARKCDVPVFLDTENLTSLKDVQAIVKKSHNLAVLLTRGVLARVWVLVEIVTAIREGIKVIPVRVTKPDAEFVFPGEEFYVQLSQDNFISDDGTQVLKEAGISILEVEAALREMFRQIAIPYSPHRNKDIRQAELQALLKRCQTKAGPPTSLQWSKSMSTQNDSALSPDIPADAAQVE